MQNVKHISKTSTLNSMSDEKLLRLKEAMTVMGSNKEKFGVLKDENKVTQAVNAALNKRGLKDRFNGG